MTWIAATLWDLLGLTKPTGAAAPPAPSQSHIDRATSPKPERRSNMAGRYGALVDEMKRTYGVRVRKWRGSSSGCAWEVHYADGTVSRLIESPYPRGPMSCAIFLHEIGHHAIGFGRYRPRCLEEYHAWRWAIETMESRGLNVTDRVRQRMHESLAYAVRKAQRRGLKRLPVELEPYLAMWGRRR